MSKRSEETGAREAEGAYWKTVHWFFSYPTKETSLGGLSKDLNMSKATANRVVSRLFNERFLKREVIGNTWRISCDQSHRYFTTRKIGYNLAMVYESGVLEGVHRVVPCAKAVVLFGSYRKGDDTENSDIDIAAEVAGDSDVRIIELCTLPRLGYRKNVHVNVHMFSRKKVDLNLFSNIANGIVLEGFLEVRP